MGLRHKLITALMALMVCFKQIDYDRNVGDGFSNKFELI